jgi:polyisoprenoid-binding protein YceI
MQTEPELRKSRPLIGHYDIDPRQSAITFRTRHMFGLAPVRGRFAIRHGTVDVAEPVTESGSYAEIDTASFRTRTSERDRTVLSPRFLDPARYPVMIFRSSGVDAEGQVLTGTLTVRDVTRPVRLSVIEHAQAPGAAFLARARTRIDRTEFGITAMRGLAGRYLDITVEVRCVRN